MFVDFLQHVFIYHFHFTGVHEILGGDEPDQRGLELILTLLASGKWF